MYREDPCSLYETFQCVTEAIHPPTTFRIRLMGCSSRSFVMRSLVCHSHVGRHRPFLSQISPAQIKADGVVVSTTQENSPRSFFARNSTGTARQQLATFLMRHFFHWPARNVLRAVQGCPAHEGGDGAKARGEGVRGSWNSCSYLDEFSYFEERDRVRSGRSLL
jgi:hypothetical protein